MWREKIKRMQSMLWSLKIRYDGWQRQWFRFSFISLCFYVVACWGGEVVACRCGAGRGGGPHCITTLRGQAALWRSGYNVTSPGSIALSALMAFHWSNLHPSCPHHWWWLGIELLRWGGFLVPSSVTWHVTRRDVAYIGPAPWWQSLTLRR